MTDQRPIPGTAGCFPNGAPPITGHAFVKGPDMFCRYRYGSGDGWERCGRSAAQHATSVSADEDWKSFPGVWEECWCAQDESNDWWRCPDHGGPSKRHWPYGTIADNPTFIPLWIDPETPSQEDQPRWEGWVVEEGVRCVVAPCCAFTFDAGHTDSDGGGYTCPLCAPPADRESTQRVLFHIVNSYQQWRNTSLGVPNEFTDDAVRIGEQHLRDVNWFPEDEGWLPNGTNLSPNDGVKVPVSNVLTLIDAELERLRTLDVWPASKLNRWKRGWNEGVIVARQVAAKKLQAVRDAYVTESIAQTTESLSNYDIQETADD